MDIKFKDNSKLRFDTFTHLEYIESTGTQCIDTGFKPNQNTRVCCKFKYNPVSGSSSVFGIYQPNNRYIGVNFDGTNIVTSSTGTTYTEVILSNGNNTDIHIVDYNNNNVILYDNVDKGSTSNLIQNTLNLYMFCLNRQGNKDEYYKGKIYYFKLYNNNVLVLDLIPAIDNNNVVCMYDTVSRTFFYNQGTGNFVAGPAIANSTLPASVLLSTTSLYHQNTPNVDALHLLNNILNAQQTAEDIVLNRIRVDIGNVSGSLSELLQYAGMAGFNDNYEQQTKPRLVGTWTINDWYTTAQLAQAQAAFDGLTIVGDPNYLINFNDLAVQVLDPNEDNYNPAVAIILQGQNLGTTMTDAPLGYGRWSMTKSQAAAVTKFETNAAGMYYGWFMNLINATDTHGIVSNDLTATYNFVSFDELQYFTSFAPTNNTYGYTLFVGCSLLERCTLPNTLNYLPNSAFRECFNLKTLNIENITIVCARCFYNCVSLEINDISHITTIETASFAGCSKVTFTTLNANVTNISESVNTKNTFVGTVSIPYLHILSPTPITGVLCNYSRNHGYNTFYNTSYKIYVGDGSSAAHDDAILTAYQAASNWSGMVSYLDTWYNYLHPTT